LATIGRIAATRSTSEKLIRAPIVATRPFHCQKRTFSG
jgi:hypothetical protein